MPIRLAVGDAVEVILPEQEVQTIGLIRFIGIIATYGMQPCVGLELLEPVTGGHNGTVDGYRYFHAEEGHGMHIKLDQIIKKLTFEDLMTKLKLIIGEARGRMVRYRKGITQRDELIENLKKKGAKRRAFHSAESSAHLSDGDMEACFERMASAKGGGGATTASELSMTMSVSREICSDTDEACDDFPATDEKDVSAILVGISADLDERRQSFTPMLTPLTPFNKGGVTPLTSVLKKTGTDLDLRSSKSKRKSRKKSRKVKDTSKLRPPLQRSGSTADDEKDDDDEGGVEHHKADEVGDEDDNDEDVIEGDESESESSSSCSTSMSTSSVEIRDTVSKMIAERWKQEHEHEEKVKLKRKTSNMSTASAASTGFPDTMAAAVDFFDGPAVSVAESIEQEKQRRSDESGMYSGSAQAVIDEMEALKKKKPMDKHRSKKSEPYTPMDMASTSEGRARMNAMREKRAETNAGLQEEESSEDDSDFTDTSLSSDSEENAEARSPEGGSSDAETGGKQQFESTLVTTPEVAAKPFMPYTQPPAGMQPSGMPPAAMPPYGMAYGMPPPHFAPPGMYGPPPPGYVPPGYLPPGYRMPPPPGFEAQQYAGPGFSDSQSAHSGSREPAPEMSRDRAVEEAVALAADAALATKKSASPPKRPLPKVAKTASEPKKGTAKAQRKKTRGKKKGSGKTKGGTTADGSTVDGGGDTDSKLRDSTSAPKEKTKRRKKGRKGASGDGRVAAAKRKFKKQLPMQALPDTPIEARKKKARLAAEQRKRQKLKAVSETATGSGKKKGSDKKKPKSKRAAVPQSSASGTRDSREREGEQSPASDISSDSHSDDDTYFGHTLTAEERRAQRYGGAMRPDAHEYKHGAAKSGKMSAKRAAAAKKRVPRKKRALTGPPAPVAAGSRSPRRRRRPPKKRGVATMAEVSSSAKPRKKKGKRKRGGHKREESKQSSKDSSSRTPVTPSNPYLDEAILAAAEDSMSPADAFSPTQAPTMGKKAAKSTESYERHNPYYGRGRGRGRGRAAPGRYSARSKPVGRGKERHGRSTSDMTGASTGPAPFSYASYAGGYPAYGGGYGMPPSFVSTHGHERKTSSSTVWTETSEVPSMVPSTMGPPMDLSAIYGDAVSGARMRF